ncbi:MAG: neuromedin U [Alphaproteobacteria bacterium]|nr:neuromedin U [Alphaproteobacteria bacterium]
MRIAIIVITIMILGDLSLYATDKETKIDPISSPKKDSKGEDTESLAKAAQNPIANMISLPFQNNTNFNAGADDQTQNILNIQPVIPFDMTPNWNLITRTILPVISQPGLNPGMGRKNGIGDMQVSFFLSPKDSGKLVWGIGQIFQVPTASDNALGAKKWATGPTGVALISKGPWLCGGLINNIWDFAGNSKRERVNQMLMQPFVNYNLPSSPGTYLTSSPIITANWTAKSRDRWVIPIGLGIGQILKIGSQPINVSAATYYNIVRPKNASDWTIRVQLQFLFPK